MNELLVEWTLLREKDYLTKCIGLKIKRKLFQQYSTEYGRIDFAHELTDGNIIITELETVIDNNAKLEYCQTQTTDYQKIKFQSDKQPKIIILIADETPSQFKRILNNFSTKNNFLLRYYSLSIVNQYYKKLMDEAIKNSGIPLVKPVANNFTHLACLNRLIFPFYEKNTTELKRDDFIEYFELKSDKADSHFKVHKQMAEYFELIKDVSNTKKLSKLSLTDYGIRFRDNINYEFVVRSDLSKNGLKRIDLSIEQKRILLEILMNGNIGEKKGKVNILYFLRFVHLTEGVWVPKGRNIDLQKLEFSNKFLNTDYTKITMANWLNFISNRCEELELTEKIKTNSDYNRVILTSLGSRVLGFMEMDLHLKRERSQIPLQVN